MKKIPNTWICPECSKPIKNENTICWNCNYKKEIKIKTCKKCGHEHENNNVLFCDECGEKLGKEAVPINEIEKGPVYRIPRDQFKQLLDSNRMTVLDGVKLGCGMYIMLPLVLFFIVLFLKIIGISILGTLK